MDRGDLIDKIVDEIDRIFGPNNFDGDSAQYAWLAKNYCISEEDDVRWQEVCEYERHEFHLIETYEENEQTELMEFLENDQAVLTFLDQLLIRYRSGAAVYVK